MMVQGGEAGRPGERETCLRAVARLACSRLRSRERGDDQVVPTGAATLGRPTILTAAPPHRPRATLQLAQRLACQRRRS